MMQSIVKDKQTDKNEIAEAAAMQQQNTSYQTVSLLNYRPALASCLGGVPSSTG